MRHLQGQWIDLFLKVFCKNLGALSRAVITGHVVIFSGGHLPSGEVWAGPYSSRSTKWPLSGTPAAEGPLSPRGPSRSSHLPTAPRHVQGVKVGEAVSPAGRASLQRAQRSQAPGTWQPSGLRAASLPASGASPQPRLFLADPRARAHTALSLGHLH